MPRADRASQFMPFSALKGYEEALKKKEKIVVEKVELSEDAIEYLNYQLSGLKPGEMVTITYFEEGNYLKKSGLVSKINKDANYITVVTTDLSFETIREITLP